VRPGDSLWRIAKRELGDEHRWPEIAQANHLRAPYRLLIGQPVSLPGFDPVARHGGDTRP
jgi:nucleoid-associated protein YgaU